MITKLKEKRKSLFSSIKKATKKKLKSKEVKTIKHVDLMDRMTNVEHFEF